ncbi:MAG: antirestriction protein ArdA [Pseudomonadota bacterium]
MTIVLHAQPYDISASGFYFRNAEEFQKKVATCRNDFGAPVEEFEIQFIDGDDIDCALAKALSLNQANYAAFFEAVDDWDEDHKHRVIIAVGECGYSFDPKSCNLDDFDVDVYEVDTLKDLAEQFVDEGLYGEIPANIAFYVDYDAMARDLSVDFAMIEIAGRRFAYACR